MYIYIYIYIYIFILFNDWCDEGLLALSKHFVGYIKIFLQNCSISHEFGDGYGCFIVTKFNIFSMAEGKLLW